MPALPAFALDEAMRFGLGVLRLPADHFWAMTPRELVAAAEGLTGRAGRVEPLGRRELAALMEAFPDRPHGAAPLGQVRPPARASSSQA